MLTWFSSLFSIHSLHFLSCSLLISHLDWKPPAKGNREAGLQLARLFGDATDPINIGNIVDKANEEAVNRLKAGTPYLLDIKLAKDVIPGMLMRLPAEIILHLIISFLVFSFFCVFSILYAFFTLPFLILPPFC
jgi:hypothetical protein